MKKFRVLALALPLFLSACSSLPPQDLQLSPQAKINKALPNVPVQLNIDDRRQSPLVGYRIDRFDNRAPINFNQSETVLHQAVTQALANAGISAFGPGGHTMTVVLDELKYDASLSGVEQTVQLSASMRVKIDNGRKEYTGRYTSNLSEAMLQTPTPADNEELVSGLFEDTLNRALNDPKLIRFIQFN